MIPSLVVLGVILAALLWFFRSGSDDAVEPTAHRKINERDDIDRSELERAERDVQDAADEDSVRDWGPGASQPRPPHLL